MSERQQYDNTNTGVLFRAKNRSSDKAPEYTGRVDVNGTEYRLAAWVKEAKNGSKFFSLSVTPQDYVPGTTTAVKHQIDEDLPF